MCYRRVVGGTMLAVLALAVLGQAGAGETKKAPTYATPQAVFDAARMAAEKNDLRAFVGTLTEDSRDAFAGAALGTAVYFKQLGDKLAKSDDDRAKLKQLAEVLAKHGVGAETSAAALALINSLKDEDPTKVPARFQKLGRALKDPAAFVAEIMPLMGKGTQPLAELKNAKLEDVKIDGDTATAKVTSTKDGAEKSEPLEFRKENGGWKIFIDLSKKKGGKGGSQSRLDEATGAAPSVWTRVGRLDRPLASASLQLTRPGRHFAS